MKFLVALISFLLTVALWPIPSSALPQDIGSGGDFVFCAEKNGAEFKGYYSLDYLLTFDREKELASVTDVMQSLDRIGQILKTKLPELSTSFNDFRSTIFNSDYSRTRIWEKAPFGVIPISDENLPMSNMIPENCRDGKIINIIQAVIRLNKDFSGTPEKIIYRYMPELMEDVKKANALQASFILIHEWLWDYSKNVDRNRRINRFLHSREIETMTPVDVRRRLLDFGFVIEPQENEVFYPTWCQTDEAAVKRLKKSRAFPWGSFKTLVKDRFCEPERGCIQNVKAMPQYFTGFVTPTAEDEFKLVSDRMGPRSPHAICKFDALGNVKCSSYMTDKGQIFMPELNLVGTISDRCLVLRSYWKQKMFGTIKEIERDLALFSIFEAKP